MQLQKLSLALLAIAGAGVSATSSNWEFRGWKHATFIGDKFSLKGDTWATKNSGPVCHDFPSGYSDKVRSFKWGDGKLHTGGHEYQCSFILYEGTKCKDHEVYHGSSTFSKSILDSKEKKAKSIKVTCK